MDYLNDLKNLKQKLLSLIRLARKSLESIKQLPLLVLNRAALCLSLLTLLVVFTADSPLTILGASVLMSMTLYVAYLTMRE